MGVVVNAENYTLTIPDIGVTLRTLLAVAGKAQVTTKRRTWKIVYKDVVIGSVRVKTNMPEQTLKGNDDDNANARSL